MEGTLMITTRALRSSYNSDRILNTAVNTGRNLANEIGRDYLVLSNGHKSYLRERTKTIPEGVRIVCLITPERLDEKFGDNVFMTRGLE